jgi:competence protein ComEC
MLLPALIFGALSFLFQSINKLLIPVGIFCVITFGATLMVDSRDRSGEIEYGIMPRIGLVKEAEKSDKVWKKVIVNVERQKSNKNWVDREEEVVLYSQYQFREGDILFFRTALESIENSGNPGEFDAKSYWKSKNIRAMGFLGEEDFTLIDYVEPNRIAAFFKGTRKYLLRVLNESLPERQASVASALLLGDKSKLSAETRDSFGNAGAMHVLAISGLHVGIIMYLLFFILKRASRWISRNTAVAITLIFLWIFAGVTGWSPSVVRATLMFSLLLIGQQVGRSGSPMNTLFFSAFLILLSDPLLLFDIGFQLSYGAMFGIFLFFEKVNSLMRPRWWLAEKAWEGTALGIAAQLFTIPLVLYHFHQFPNYFWLTNLGVMALAGAILALGLILFIVHGIPFLNMGIALLLGWALYTLILFIDWVDSLPWGIATGFQLQVSEIILFLSAMLILLIVYKKKWMRWSVITLLVVMVSSWQWGRFEATEKSEWIVFNSNSPVIACKSEGEIHAFYTGKKEKAKRLLDAYSKVSPGVVKLDSLENNLLVKVGGKRIEIHRNKNGILMESSSNKVFLRTRYIQLEEPFDVIVDMPYLEANKAHFNLSEGPYRVAF